MLILLSRLLVRPLAIIVTLATLGLRLANVWKHAYICQSFLHVLSNAMVEHKDELWLHLVYNCDEALGRYRGHAAVGLLDHR